MKKNAPNLIVNLQNNFSSFQKYLSIFKKGDLILYNVETFLKSENSSAIFCIIPFNYSMFFNIVNTIPFTNSSSIKKLETFLFNFILHKNNLSFHYTYEPSKMNMKNTLLNPQSLT